MKKEGIGFIAVMVGILGLALFSLQSCQTFYNQPICSVANRVDVPNFEGSYILKMVNPSTAGILSLKTQIIRSETGHYVSADGSVIASEIYTCKIGLRTLLEYRQTYGKDRVLYLAYELKANDDYSFDLVSLNSDPELLKQQGIPFEITTEGELIGPRLTALAQSLAAPEPSPSVSPGPTFSIKTLVIDSSKVSAETMDQVLDPLSFRITLIATDDFKARKR